MSILPTTKKRGLFGFLDSDPGAPEEAGILSRLPLSGDQKTQILFSGLQDAVGAFSGQPSDNLAKTRGAIEARASASAKKAAQDGLGEKLRVALGDPANPNIAAARAVMMEAAGQGIDLSPYVGAMSFGQPKYQNVGGDLLQLDEFGGAPPKVIRSNEREAPSGYRWNGGSLEFIPGGPADPAVIGAGSGARRAPKPAAPSGIPGLGAGWTIKR